MYDNIHGKLPISFDNIFHMNYQMQGVYETRQAHMFHVPRTKSLGGKRKRRLIRREGFASRISRNARPHDPGGGGGRLGTPSLRTLRR